MGEKLGEIIASIGPGGEAAHENEKDRWFHGRFACWVMARSCDRVAVRMSRRIRGPGEGRSLVRAIASGAVNVLAGIEPTAYTERQETPIENR